MNNNFYLNECLVCNSNNLDILGPLKNKHITYSKLNLTECNSCKLVFANPMPSEEKLIEYNSSYFNTAHGDSNLRPIDISFFRGLSKIRLNHLTKFLIKNKIECSKVLEIGPGPGYFAESWLELNPKTKYFAVETDSSCHDSLTEIGVELINLGDMIKVDLIVISHVLEHVSDPMKFLNEVIPNLNEGGVLFIEVPCNDYLHKDLHEPHLLFFSKLPMMALLEKLHFKNIEISYHGETISNLIKKSKSKWFLNAVKYKLMSFGLIFPFSFKSEGMELINNRQERASVSSSKAYKENTQPSWWLRAISIK
jgi:SAM-dependent methyltransferase